MADESKKARKPAAKKTTRKATTRRSTTTARRTAKPSGAAATTSEQKPTLDEIRERAYFRYIERGGNHGDDQRDWFEAEQELLDRRK